MEAKKIDIKEFRAKGFLQEVNRKFFHPLGLALEVKIDDVTGEESLNGIGDCREWYKNVFFGEDIISKDKIDYIENLRKLRVKQRRENKDGFEIDKNGLQIN